MIMCFTVNVNLVKDELEERYGTTFSDHNRFQPSYYYHAFSFPELPAICSGSPGRISMLKWGLIPGWVRSAEDAKAIRIKTFNARAESVDTKPSYSASFMSKRCLIPVKGFFEWQHAGKEKIPWYIYHSDNQILSLAGLYSEWTGTLTGETITTFTIITTAANDLMEVIHNSKKRMPVILQASEEKKWINMLLSPAEAHDLLKPCPSDTLKAHTVSNLVNARYADKNRPEVIEEFIRDSGNTLF